MNEEIPSWCEKYIGIPFVDLGRDFSGADCWGLSRLVYLHQLQIKLVSYVDKYHDAEDEQSILKLIHEEKAKWIKVEKPRMYDMALINLYGIAAHCGVILNNRWFLHTLRGHESVRERYDSTGWKNRMVAFYRHELLIKKITCPRII